MFIGIGLDMTRGSGGGATLPGSTMDMNFATGVYLGASPSNLTVTRSGTNATDLTYDQTTRTSYNSFAANTARIVADGRGLLVEESRTQYLGVTDVPANQTTGALTTGNHVLWCIGGTSVTIAAGTATITGTGSATPGTPLVVNVTAGGTATITVSGAVLFFQLEKGAFPTSYIPNAGAAGTTSTRATDSIVISGAALTAWYTAGAGVLFAQHTRFATSNANGSLYAAAFSDGTANNLIAIGNNFAGSLERFEVKNGGVSQFLYASGTAVKTRIKKAITWTTNNANGAISGSLVGADDTSVTVPTVDRLTIGAYGAGLEPVCGFVERVAYTPAASDATATSWTT